MDYEKDNFHLLDPLNFSVHDSLGWTITNRLN